MQLITFIDTIFKLFKNLSISKMLFVTYRSTVCSAIWRTLDLLPIEPMRKSNGTQRPRHDPSKYVCSKFGGSRCRDRTAMSIHSHLGPYLKGLRLLPANEPLFSIRDWAQNEDEDEEQDKEKNKKKRKAKNKQKQQKESSPKSDAQWPFIAATPDQRETLKAHHEGSYGKCHSQPFRDAPSLYGNYGLSLMSWSSSKSKKPFPNP